MIPPFLAGRSTLRRLHQTVQRNLNHYPAKHSKRWESSKPPNTPNRNASPTANASSKQAAATEVFGGAYWAWVEPIKIPFRGYSNMQQRSPLLTQWESTLIIYFLGDLSAQTVQTNVFTEGRYEPKRGLIALIIGGIVSIPSYKWFLWLGRNFNYAQHWKSLAAKIVVSQMCFTPTFNTYFFGMQTILSGGSFKEAKDRVIRTVPVSWKNSWKLWPLVTAFTFTFIRPVNRNVFAGFIAIGWQTYLSWLNRLAEAEAKKKGVGAVKRRTKKIEEKR
ncbi:Protein SYM1 [Pseudocercospora fuligena]|uniref:Protein SYM1 n=1 Tax=Pseudocercospora fuligena TaxID=685502 RepID=A0A8H6RE02_9PEZI|nr:Protein SYM1 [Pseudocercospora fuligena]